jgi:hypothetical protein
MLPKDHTLSRFSYFYRGEDTLIYERIVACKSYKIRNMGSWKSLKVSALIKFIHEM